MEGEAFFDGFAFDNTPYKERCYCFEKEEIKTRSKKLALSTKIVLCTVTTLIILLLVIFFTSEKGEQEDINKIAGIYNSYGPKEKLTGQKVLKILFWTQMNKNFGKNSSADKIDRTKCLITYNQSEVNTADVIVFQADTEDYPKQLYPNQTLVYSSLEPAQMKVSEEIKFDWTATFNVTSTIPLQTMIFVPAKSNISSDIAANKTKRADVHVALWYEKTNEKNTFKDKVDSLNKFVKIDPYEYSENINSTCSKHSNNTNLKQCLHEIKKDYKFYLVLEDHCCSDFISIKFYRALQQDLIPIVWGSAPRHLYEKMGPPNNVPVLLHIEDDFKSNFTLLKNRLEEINSNDTAFNEFFVWKSNYKVITNYPWFSELCDMAHTRRQGNTKLSALSINELNGSSCSRKIK